jgi:hypothetical protein
MRSVLDRGSGLSEWFGIEGADQCQAARRVVSCCQNESVPRLELLDLRPSIVKLDYLMHLCGAVIVMTSKINLASFHHQKEPSVSAVLLEERQRHVHHLH